MGKRITVALDAMGGDYAPLETVKGAVDAVKELDVNIKLVGSVRSSFTRNWQNINTIRNELKSYTPPRSSVRMNPLRWRFAAKRIPLWWLR